MLKHIRTVTLGPRLNLIEFPLLIGIEVHKMSLALKKLYVLSFLFSGLISFCTFTVKYAVNKVLGGKVHAISN